MNVVVIAVLGLVFAYIWRSNGRMQRAMVEVLERMEQGQKSIMEGQERMMEALVKIEEGQREGLKYLADLIAQESRATRALMKKK